jgi:Tol biopolymer transport system component
MGGQCVGKVKPNSERKLVLSKDGYYLFNPIWHPSGEWIYYLVMPIPDPPEGPQPSFTGSIWRVNTNGTDERMILDGHFSCLALSHVGNKVAFIKGSYPIHTGENDNKIIIADTSGVILDTIQTTGENIYWIKFCNNDSKIYYSSTFDSDSFGYFRINLDGTEEEHLSIQPQFSYFDLFSDNSLYINSNPPSLHPQNPNYVVFSDYRNKLDLILKNLSTGAIDSLMAAPYGTPVYIDLPHWSPDGQKVIYCVGPERGEDRYIQKLELWMVEGIELK